MAFESFKSDYEKVPKPVRVFLIRALIIFIVWKAIYILLLQPDRTLDKPLTDITAMLTAKIFSWFSGNDTFITYGNKTILWSNGKRVLAIMDGCNGLELFVVYIGFLLSMPVGMKKFWTYAILGCVTIFVLNIMRCVGLTWLISAHKQYADFAHHYLFKLVIYGFIFYCWVRYSKNYLQHETR